ncbi:HPr(Ser) kinase/phosphatase [candidate division KSB1 bacterium]|nr:HPr(Ser) kinase/phosphatase [candidate division KSB1 bacterium]
MNEITIETLYYENKKRLKLEIVNNDSGFDNVIKEPELHRPGLALGGFVDVFTYNRVQIVGNTELAFLETLTPTKKEASVKKVLEFALPCIIITDNNIPPDELIKIANEKKITILRSVYSTTHVIQILSSYLEKKFAPFTSIHGSMVDVYGIGVLLTGRSGIGKSEIALDLVERGHRLVADDVVHITRQAEGIIIATGSEVLQHHMEIRGIGIIDVRSIFGIRSIRLKKRVEVEVHLEDWEEGKDYERIGLEEKMNRYLDVDVPLVNLPIFPGKNVTVIIETIALNQLLKIYGFHTAEEFNEKLIQRIQNSRDIKDYLFFDLE